MVSVLWRAGPSGTLGPIAVHDLALLGDTFSRDGQSPSAARPWPLSMYTAADILGIVPKKS
jgi:hypothetical protein